MTLRNMAAAVVLCGFFLASAISFAKEKRGPSTAEERQQVLQYVHNWQADPLGPQAKNQAAWVTRWFIDVPDLTVHLCSILDKLPKGDKKDSSTIFAGMFMAQAGYVLENADKQGDLLPEYQAGVEGALRVYEMLVKANSKDRQSYFDDLVARRTAGTLDEFVKQRADAACKK